jgi:peptidoglycan/xylan/chitin deacetylase (PgdA/CDA1 family)
VSRATVCLTVDNLGLARAVGRREATRPDPDEPGLRYGLPRALEMFARRELTATFFVEGWNALHHPDALLAMVEGGHEVGLHGWLHERWAELSEQDRERLIFDGSAALRSAGIKCCGFRASGGYRGTRTASVLKELGYIYDSSIDVETEWDPVSVRRLPEGLISIPWHWDMVDYCQYLDHSAFANGRREPHEVEAHWVRVFEDTVEKGGLLTMILHPYVTFVNDARVAVLERFLDRVASEPNVDVVNCLQLATATLENA